MNRSLVFLAIDLLGSLLIVGSCSSCCGPQELQGTATDLSWVQIHREIFFEVGGSLFSMKVDGSGRRQLLKNPEPHLWKWQIAPNLTRIACELTYGSDWIEIVQLPSGAVTRLAKPGRVAPPPGTTYVDASEEGFCFSPDGKKIVLERATVDTNGDRRIDYYDARTVYVLDVDTGKIDSELLAASRNSGPQEIHSSNGVYNTHFYRSDDRVFFRQGSLWTRDPGGEERLVVKYLGKYTSGPPRYFVDYCHGIFQLL